MNEKQLTTRLAAAEASLKRWMTRHKRAATMVHQLDKTTRRYRLMLLSQNQPVAVTVKVRKDKPLSETIDVAEVQRQLDAAIATVTPQKIADVAAVVHEKTEGEGIPKWLDRSDPLFNEKATKARKLAEAEERKKMPLADKDALQYIKKGDKKKEGKVSRGKG